MREKLDSIAKRLDDLTEQLMGLASEIRQMQVEPEKQNVNSKQQERLAQWIITQHPRIIYPDEVKRWLVTNGWKESSVSVLAYLVPYGITSNGKNKGYSYHPKSNSSGA